MDGILDGKPGMTMDELIALLEKGQITATSRKVGGIFVPKNRKTGGIH